MLLASCSRQKQRNIERLSILPFENLTLDATLDWAGAAVSGLIAAKLTGSPHLRVATASGPRQAELERATQTIQGYFERRGGGLRFYAVLRDVGGSRVVKTFEASGSAATLTGAADSIAGQTGEPLRTMNAPSGAALQAWGQSLVAADPKLRSEALEAAVQADPGFGLAQADLAHALLASGQRSLAAEAIERARPRLASFPEIERTRIEFADAELKGDVEGRRKSLVALSKLITTDVRTLQVLAEMELNRRDFAGAAGYYRSALAITPDDTSLLNAIGYAEAYRGNFDAARQSLERYRDSQPDELNPIDSLGEVEFMAGRFEQAEKLFLDAHGRNPGFLSGAALMKAAQCRLMRGDVAGGDELFAKYRTLLGPANAFAPILQAQWLYFTGRRKEAFAGIRRATAGPGVVGIYANTQLAVWSALAGDFTGAKAAAAQCTQSNQLCLTAKVFSDPDWTPPEAVGPGFDAYRALLKKDFQGALPRLKSAFERTPPGSDAEVRTLYAWALVETGRTTEAAPLVERYPLIMGGNDLLAAGVSYPRYFALLSAVRKQQGRADEAARALELYKKYGGA